MNFLTKAANVARGAIVGMTTGNPLRPPLLYAPLGLRDASFQTDARNAYMAVATVFGCVSAYCKNAPQIKFIVKHKSDKSPWPDHPCQWLIQHPNDDMSEKRLALFNSVYKPLGGASMLYLYRSKRNMSQIIGWRPFSTMELAPVPRTPAPYGRESWLNGYNHIAMPYANVPEPVDFNDVIPLTWHSVNPLIPQAYLSPIAVAFEDINADKAIAQLPGELLKNMAFMSAVFHVSIPPEAPEDDGLFEDIKADVVKQVTGRAKGTPLVIRDGVKAEALMPKLRDLDLANISERPQLGICNALDVPPRYMAMAAAIDASTSDNYVASWLSFFKGPITVQAQLDADAMTDFFTAGQRNISWSNHPTIAYGCDARATNDFVIEPDFSDCGALQAERIQREANDRANWQAGGVTWDEFRSKIQMPTTDEMNDEALADLGEKLFFDLNKGSGFTASLDPDAINTGGRSNNVMRTPQFSN